MQNSATSTRKSVQLLRANPDQWSNNRLTRLRLLYCRTSGMTVCTVLSRMLAFLLCCIQNITVVTSHTLYSHSI